MIDDAVLLQADTTLIAGILIFLTIRRISNTVASEISERKLIVAMTFFALFWLGDSAAFLLVAPIPPPYTLLFIPKYFTVIGVIGLVFTVGLILTGLLSPSRKERT
jgi:hypothetical protein